jgi:hypothetical protein
MHLTASRPHSRSLTRYTRCLISVTRSKCRLSSHSFFPATLVSLTHSFSAHALFGTSFYKALKVTQSFPHHHIELGQRPNTMHFNSSSLMKLTLATALALEANAMDLKPWGTDHHPGDQSVAKRAPTPLELTPMRPDEVHSKVFGKRALPSVELKAISDPSILLRGRSEKREMPGNGCFDPAKHSTFFWGGYGTYSSDLANSHNLLTTDSWRQHLRCKLYHVRADR